MGQMEFKERDLIEFCLVLSFFFFFPPDFFSPGALISYLQFLSLAYCMTWRW